MATLADFNAPQEGWGAEPHGIMKKRHYIREGRHLCNGIGAKSRVSDTTLNLPGGCRVCKTMLGLCTPWYPGYADPRRRGGTA